jgi:hypothetical protein
MSHWPAQQPRPFGLATIKMHTLAWWGFESTLVALPIALVVMQKLKAGSEVAHTLWPCSRLVECRDFLRTQVNQI